MKNYLIILTLFLSFLGNAQSWQAVGVDDFEQISYPGAQNPNVYADTLGSIYLFYAELLDNYGITPPYNTHYKYVLKKETTAGWINLTDIEYTTYAHSFGMNKAGEFFFTKDTTINGSTALIIRKFDGTSWSMVGQPYSLNFASAPYCKMQFDKNDNPCVLFSAYGNSVSPEIIRWDGSNWSSIGGPIVNTIYRKFLFDFNNSNEAHLLYYDALNNQAQIKKFDGSNWIVTNTNVPSAVININTQSYAKIDFKINKDTMYIAYGQDGTFSSLGGYPPSCYVLKYDGTSWSPIVSIPTLNTTLPNTAPASVNLVFDTSNNNIYLSGGYILKVQGDTVVNWGLQGDLAIRNDTFYTVDNARSFGYKIRFIKAFNNHYIEDYPVSIPSFVGGGISYNILIGAYYYYSTRHTFFVDDISYMNLVEVKYMNNKWEPTNGGIGINYDYPKIYTDKTNTPYILKGYTTSPLSLYLYRISQDTSVAIGGNIINNYFSYGSCAFDTNNIPYVAFIDKTTFGGNRVRVKKYDTGSWVDLSTVYPFVSANASSNPLLFVDTLNQINVLYKEGSNLKFSAFDGTNWKVISSSYGSIVDSNFQLAVNTVKQPYVSYTASFGGKKKPVVVKFDGIKWDTVGHAGFTAGAVEDVNFYMDKDTPLLAYSDKTFGKAIIAKYNGVQWGL